MDFPAMWLMQADPVPQQSQLLWGLRSLGAQGAFIVLAGGLLSAWGLVNVAAPRNRTMILVQVALGLVPLGLTFIAAFDLAGEFRSMATSAVPPKPAEFAEVVSRAIWCGMLGPLAAALPVGLGLLALVRSGILRRPPDA